MNNRKHIINAGNEAVIALVIGLLIISRPVVRVSMFSL